MGDCKKCHGPEYKSKTGECPPKVIQINNPQEPILFHRVDIPAVIGDDETYPPKVGLYRNVLTVYEANGHAYMYSSDGVPTLIEEGIPQEIWDDLAMLKDDVVELEATDATLQQEIDDIKNNPDVVDIVSTYAALQAYDTSILTDKDVVRVLADETHEGQSTYYRWSATTHSWTYVGSVGDYYTKAQVDTLLSGKQDTLTAGANVQISAQNVISATDTTYTAGGGLTLTGTQFDVNITNDQDWSSLWQ